MHRCDCLIYIVLFHNSHCCNTQWYTSHCRTIFYPPVCYNDKVPQLHPLQMPHYLHTSMRFKITITNHLSALIGPPGHLTALAAGGFWEM